jgi:hypothetical protein
MNRIFHTLLLTCAIVSMLLTMAGKAAAQGTAFTYQGRITYQGDSYNGTVDLRFSLYDSLTGGSQIGDTVTNTGVFITNGLFTVTLDFGTNAFSGANRWLGIAVGTDSEMSPRQSLTPTPYAIYAESAGAYGGSITDTQLSANVALLNGNQAFTGSNLFTGVSIYGNVSNAFLGSFTGDGSAVSNLNASSLSSGTVDDSRLSANVAKLGADQTFTGSNVFTGTVKSISGANEYYMVPKGGIILWSGSEGTIPSGWALCNGGNGTPDLRNRFVVGAGTGSVYAVGATGGATNHTHDTAIGAPTTSSAGAHTHTTATGTTGSESAHTHSVNPPSTTSGSSGAHTHAGGTLAFARGVDVTGSGSGGSFSVSLNSGAGANNLTPNAWAGATASSGAHTHSIDIASFASAAGSAHSHSIPALGTDSQGAHTHTVSIGTIPSTSADSRPPYYALCYIMKL